MKNTDLIKRIKMGNPYWHNRHQLCVCLAVCIFSLNSIYLLKYCSSLRGFASLRWNLTKLHSSLILHLIQPNCSNWKVGPILWKNKINTNMSWQIFWAKADLQKSISSPTNEGHCCVQTISEILNVQHLYLDLTTTIGKIL